MHLGMYVPDKWLTRDDILNESKNEDIMWSGAGKRFTKKRKKKEEKERKP
jgi:hypothetical protein